MKTKKRMKHADYIPRNSDSENDFDEEAAGHSSGQNEDLDSAGKHKKLIPAETENYNEEEACLNDESQPQHNRGPVTGKKQTGKRKRDGGKTKVEYNSLGVPIGEPGDDLSTLVGVLARSAIPITYNDWRNVPQELKERIWETVNVSTESLFI